MLCFQDVITSAELTRRIQIEKVTSTDVPDSFEINWFHVEFPKFGFPAESTPLFHQCSELIYDWRLVQGLYICLLFV